MPKTDEGKRFTDLAYATKEEVKAVYNRDNVQREWEKVLSYRATFTCDSELRDNDQNAYFLVLSPAILKECYALEENLFKDLVLYLSLSRSAKESFLLKRKTASLLALSHHGLDKIPSQATLERIARNEIENVPTSLFLLGEYSHAFDSPTFLPDEHGLFRLNNALQGERGEEAMLRTSNAESLVNTLRHPLPERIPDGLTSYFLFLEQKDIPLLARAVLSIHFFLSALPFEYMNEETGALFVKNFLFHSGLDAIGLAMDFESVFFARSKRFYERLKETEESLDLTYVLAFVLPFLTKDEEGIRQLLEECRKEAPSKEEDIEKPSAFDSELALPTFQKSEDRKTIDERAKKLREIYPFLKKKEAHFYASHCTIGSFYTIEDFRKEELTVYETARSSMESLARKGFYRKEQQGKKFVYAPIPMKDEPADK